MHLIINGCSVFQCVQAGAEDEAKDKRMKGCAEEGESKITEQNNNKNNSNNNRETSGDTSKDNSKVSEVQKRDYIHVRARRGQATDSHSLAERVSYSFSIFWLYYSIGYEQILI